MGCDSGEYNSETFCRMERVCATIQLAKIKYFRLVQSEFFSVLASPLILIYSISVFMDFFFLTHIYFPVCISHVDGLPHSKSGLR